MSGCLIFHTERERGGLKTQRLNCFRHVFEDAGDALQRRTGSLAGMQRMAAQQRKVLGHEQEQKLGVVQHVELPVVGPGQKKERREWKKKNFKRSRGAGDRDRLIENRGERTEEGEQMRGEVGRTELRIPKTKPQSRWRRLDATGRQSARRQLRSVNSTAALHPVGYCRCHCECYCCCYCYCRHCFDCADDEPPKER